MLLNLYMLTKDFFCYFLAVTYTVGFFDEIFSFGRKKLDL